MTRRSNRFKRFSIAELQHLLAGMLSSPFRDREVEPTKSLTNEISEMLDQKIKEEETD